MKSTINIFFSYSSIDSDIVNILKLIFKIIDIEDKLTYFDYTEIQKKNDTSTYNKILNNINSSKIFLAILSEDYLKSPLCCWEAGIAVTQCKTTTLLAVKKEEKSLELYHTFSNIFNFDSDGIEKLIKQIKVNFDIRFKEIIIPKKIQNIQSSLESILISEAIENLGLDEKQLELINRITPNVYE